MEIEKEQLSNELYCQAYEMEAMADLLIRKETERWVSGFADMIVEIEHSSRYKWILKYVKNKRVLDIACGVGKGSYTIAKNGEAKEVIGCDLNERAIKYASIRYKHPNITFVSDDAQKFTNENNFDVIVSFETIEHLPNVDQFLKSIDNLLSSNGLFFVSTPLSSIPHDTNPVNPYHIQEWDFNEFEKLLSKYFEVDETYLQLRKDNFGFFPYWKIWIKNKILCFFERKYITNLKNHFLDKNNVMNPVKIEKRDSLLLKNLYGISGYQIFVLKKK